MLSIFRVIEIMEGIFFFIVKLKFKNSFFLDMKVDLVIFIFNFFRLNSFK